MPDRIMVRPFLGWVESQTQDLTNLVNLRWYPGPSSYLTSDEEMAIMCAPDFPCRSAEVERLESYRPRGA